MSIRFWKISIKFVNYNRLCNVCALYQSPTDVTCEICLKPGGALKPTTVAGQWVHVQCASWIPEVLCVNYKTVEPFDLSRLDRKRYKLKCALCSSKGACIQCCYGRCTSAVHARCALATGSGHTHRIIADENGFALWEMFCKSHADAVKNPIKPKSSKQKAQQSALQSQTADEKDQNPKASQSVHATDECPYTSTTTSIGLDCSSASVQDAVRILALSMAEQDMSSWLQSQEKINLAQIPTKDPACYVLSDWPGQSEGKAMDLAHFWDVVSMYYSRQDFAQVYCRCEKSNVLCVWFVQ